MAILDTMKLASPDKARARGFRRLGFDSDSTRIRLGFDSDLTPPPPSRTGAPRARPVARRGLERSPIANLDKSRQISTNLDKSRQISRSDRATRARSSPRARGRARGGAGALQAPLPPLAPPHPLARERRGRAREGRCFRLQGAHRLRPVRRRRCNATHCCSQAQAEGPLQLQMLKPSEHRNSYCLKHGTGFCLLVVVSDVLTASSSGGGGGRAREGAVAPQGPLPPTRWPASANEGPAAPTRRAPKRRFRISNTPRARARSRFRPPPPPPTRVRQSVTGEGGGGGGR